MSRRNNDYLDAKVYVGGLPEDATSQELEDAFHRFGRIRKVWVARRPPGFAFIEFEDARDAEDAVKGMDGNRICGVRARVELSNDHALARRTVDALVNAARRHVDLPVMTMTVNDPDHLDKSIRASGSRYRKQDEPLPFSLNNQLIFTLVYFCLSIVKQPLKSPFRFNKMFCGFYM